MDGFPLTAPAVEFAAAEVRVAAEPRFPQVALAAVPCTTAGIIALRRQVKAILGSFRAISATIGNWNTCLYATSRALAALSGDRVRIVKYYFMAQPVAAPSEAEHERGGSFTFEFVAPGRVQFSGLDRPASVIAARFAQGAHCLVANDRDARFAGFLWFIVGPYDEDEVRARFEPRPRGEAAWDFDVTILPRYRMGRLFGYLWQRASAELASRGIRHSLSRISAFNGPSLASHRRLGARVVGQALFVCAGRIQLMRASVSPRWHLSWREEQRPVLAIEA